MKNSFYWSQEELCLLWLGVGASLKSQDIGKPINRSQTAVLKATKRYKIADLPKPYDAKRIWKELVATKDSPEFPDLCTFVLASHGISFAELSSCKFAKNFNAPASISTDSDRGTDGALSEWGRWADVLSFLDRAGICIQKCPPHLTWAEFLINKRPSSRKQALMLMNQLRSELSLPPMLVAGITE